MVTRKSALFVHTVILTVSAINCQKSEIKDYFQEINSQLLKFNAFAAKITWDSSVSPQNEDLTEKTTEYLKARLEWQHRTCNKLVTLQNAQLLNDTQRRQTYLLCRGVKYTFDEASQINILTDTLQSAYSDNGICINENLHTSSRNISNVISSIMFHHLKEQKTIAKDPQNSSEILMEPAQQEVCLRGETDFARIMSVSRDPEVLKFVWTAWREKLGGMKKPFLELMDVENRAAFRSGYSDIGAVWREELETPNLRELCRTLYEEIRPLYQLLHGIVRFYLRMEYGDDLVPERGPIPAHLLGDLWSQNWESIVDLIVTADVDLEGSLEKLNWSNKDMVKKAEDFYQSMGLPPMTESFWRHSVFDNAKADDAARCHGSAADMFTRGDFRLLYCLESPSKDFYVIHHELGHIHYYMAYEDEPAIYRQGTNSAFHESIGDAIMLGVLSPQHLHRFGIVNDTVLYSDDFEPQKQEHSKKEHLGNEKEEKSLSPKTVSNKIRMSTANVLNLKRALNEIPQIPFALMLEEYRWSVFEGGIDEGVMNEEYWNMVRQFQGVEPSEERGEEYFDIAAKFHVPDNTPYVRYFLASFLHHQLFEQLCRSAVFGRARARSDLPHSVTLARCDVYGSKSAGKVLRAIMSRGSSQNWRTILQQTTGRDHISVEPLKKYYQPLFNVLRDVVDELEIPIGW